MPTLQDQDQNLDNGTPYDDGGWHTNVRGGSEDFDWDGMEKNLATPGAGDYDESDPSSKARRGDGVDGPGLENLEGRAGAAPSAEGSALPGEKSALEDASFKAGKAVGEANGKARLGRMGRARVAMNSRRGRAFGVGGIIITMIVMFLAISSGGLDTEHYKSNFITKVNAAANRQLKKRRAKNIIKSYRKVQKELKTNGLAATAAEREVALAARAELEGNGFSFNEGQGGDIASLEFSDSSGTKGLLDFNAENFDGELSRFFEEGGPAFTEEFFNAIEPNNALLGESFRGPAATSWLERFKFSLDEKWLEKTSEDPNATPEEQLQSNVEHANDNLDQRPTVDGDTVSKDPNTDEKGKGQSPTEVIADSQQQSADAVNDLTKGTLEDIKASESASQVASEAVDAAEGDFPSLVKSASADLVKTASEETAKAGIDPLVVAQQACKAKGAIDVVNHVRRYAYAMELIRFGMKFMAFADTRKAGYSSSKANALMELYMHRPNATTGQSFGSGGATANAFGDKTVHASSASLSKYSVGYASGGILASISRFIAPYSSGCKVANNTWLNIGVGIIGIATLVFAPEANIGAALTAAGPILAFVVAQDIITKIGTPILIRTGAHLALSGVESGDILEAAVTSGVVGGMNGMNNAHVMLPASIPLSTALHYDAAEHQKQELAKAGFFDRYLNIRNESSLVGRIAVNFASSAQTIRGGGVVNFAGRVASGTQSKLARSIFPSTYAATDQTSLCEDKQITNNAVASDDFCNVYNERTPDLDPLETHDILFNAGQITNEGAPSSEEFKNYIKQCASGAPGLLYQNDVKSDGSSGSGETNLCLEGGTPLAGETRKLADAYSIKDLTLPKVAWWQKAIGNSAFAAPAETTSKQLVGINDRYAAWLGYLDDISDVHQTLTNDFGQTSSNSPGTSQTNNLLFMVGDSLTVGMNGLPGAASLSSKLTGAGWAPTINAQGCRGVYQSNGPINGDGKNCPKETIIDALTVVNDPANEAQLKAAGTYIVALGTNGTETNVAEFKQKATELITKLKSLNPSATIFWLNVRLQTNSAKAKSYNDMISQVASEQAIRILDWDAYVSTVNSDADAGNDVTWPGPPKADSTHNDTNGYTKKIQFIIDGLGPAPSANSGGGGSIDCTAPVGNVKLICAAEKYQGIRYAFTTSAQIKKAYGIDMAPPAGMRGGANAATWLSTRVVGGPNDFVECSGFANLSMWVAFGYHTTAGCSGYYVKDNDNDGFADADKNLKVVSLNNLQPGDFLTESQNCNTPNTPGHIAIYMGKSSAGHYLTIESSAGKNIDGQILSGFYDRTPDSFAYASRYVGPGSTL